MNTNNDFGLNVRIVGLRVKVWVTIRIRDRVSAAQLIISDL